MDHLQWNFWNWEALGHIRPFIRRFYKRNVYSGSRSITWNLELSWLYSCAWPWSSSCRTAVGRWDPPPASATSSAGTRSSTGNGQTWPHLQYRLYQDLVNAWGTSVLLPPQRRVKQHWAHANRQLSLWIWYAGKLDDSPQFNTDIFLLWKNLDKVLLV